VRIPKSAARKRRLAVLRQMSAEEPPASGLHRAVVFQRHESERFINACGATLPLRVSIKNERSGEMEDVFIERPWAVIGGDPKCDIRLLHPDVSQRHAYLQFVGSRVLCCDLGSRTGTHGSSESRPRGWLETDEPVYVGPFSIRILDNEFDAETGASLPQSRGAESLDLPPAYLSFVNARNSDWGQTSKRISRNVTLIGWSSSCKVRLQHSSVGRAHCSLVLTPDGLWVVNLLCSGGTQVNGNAVECARLEEGDELAVGRFLMRVSYTTPVEDEAQDPASPGSTSDADLRRLGEFDLPEAEAPAPKAIEFQASEVVSPLPARPAAPPCEQPSGLIFRPATLALPPNHSLPDAVAQSLIQQFSTMQQQMFDHMQQALATMAQTLNAAQARQLESIRDELIRMQPVEAVDSPPLAAPRSGTGRPPSESLRPPIRGSGLGRGASE
jgi:pSer/pThr/pTyr-binding forkhead associated (FHA) protein